MKTVYSSFSRSFTKLLPALLAIVTFSYAQAQFEYHYTPVATLGNTETLGQPFAVAIDQNNNAYVADYLKHRVQIFNAAGEPIRQISSEGTTPGKLKFPSSIAITPNQQHLYVGHQQGVEVFTLAGEFVRRISTKHVDGIAIEAQAPGRIFLSTAFEILVYSADFAEKLPSIGTQGGGNGQLDNCRDIVLDKAGHLFAADMGNERIQVFTTQGEYIAQFRTSAKLHYYPSGLAIDGMDNLYVASQGADQIVTGYFDFTNNTWYANGGFGPTGTKASHFQSPIDITVVPSGIMAVADVHSHQVTLLMKDVNEITQWENLTKTFGNEDFIISASNVYAPEYQVKFEKVEDPAFTGDIAITYNENHDYVVKILRGGQVKIRASMADGLAFSEATKDITLTIDKAGQEITFAPLDIRVFGEAPFTINATATSGLPVTFESNNTAIATVANNTVTLKSPGIMMIVAKQDGNENYLAAYPVRQVLEIDAITGTAYEEHNSIRVYPIPAQDAVTINAPFTNDVTPVTICDAWGRTVRQQTPEVIDAQHRRISLAGLTPGLYLLQLNDGKTTQRLIKN
jgi:hypothetical protein